MAEKEIRLPKWDGKEYYPATTTEAVADRERQKGLNEVLSDIEYTIDSYNRANQIMLNQKQDKLHYYTENTATDTAVIKVSHDTDEATFHEDKVEVGVDNCVLLKSEDLLLGEDSYIKVSSEKVSMSSPQGKIDDAVGALVSNANAIAALNGTGEGSVSKKVTDEIAKVIANAPADFDTLKEIADYIDSDKTNAAEINNTLTALKTRIYELGDFPTSGDAERKAAEETISKSPSISIIHYTVNGSASHIILQDVNDALTQQVLYYGGHTYIRHIGPNLNANWEKTNPTNIKYNQDSHRIALMHMVNQYGEGDNNIDWVELPTATDSKDGLMTKEQVKSLEGKQDQLANYVEEPMGKTTIKYPNGTAKVEVSNVRAALWANDDKAAIAADKNGTRMLYQKTAEDGSIEHRDEISIGRHDDSSATHITLTSKSTNEEAGEKLTNESSVQVTPDGVSVSSPNGTVADVVKAIINKQPLLTGDEFKTINGQSIMGEGDIEIEGGEGGGIDSEPTNAVIESIEPSLVSTALRKTAQVLTEDEKEQARKNIGAQKQLQLTVKDNGNIVLSNLNGQSQEFMPATPSGDPMHYAYVSAGAEYNATGVDSVKTGVFGDTITHKAGYWYLNEIGDLSNQEIAKIYSERWPSRSTPIPQYFWAIKSRTACIDLAASSGLSNYMFYHSYNVEKLKLTSEKANSITLSTSTMASIISLSSLTKILTILKANNTTAFNSWFDGCVALEEVRILGLKCSISFKYCSNISQTSVKYMIEKATPTSAISITLHADAYARLAEDADIVAALEAKPLVTLVSA